MRNSIGLFIFLTVVHGELKKNVTTMIHQLYSCSDDENGREKPIQMNNQLSLTVPGECVVVYVCQGFSILHVSTIFRWVFGIVLNVQYLVCVFSFKLKADEHSLFKYSYSETVRTNCQCVVSEKNILIKLLIKNRLNYDKLFLYVKSIRSLMSEKVNTYDSPGGVTIG